MKRYGNLWEKIIDFSNLMQAARNAQRGKRFRPNVLAFNDQLEPQLIKLQYQLQTQTYHPGTYHTFEIKSPKPRMISAAPYRDRVVHHAVCAIIAPIFESTFIRDSYANRINFGSHRALRRFTHFARSSRYILQCDIRKYFPSIDHDILKTLLRRKLKCSKTLELLDLLIDSSNPQEPRNIHFPGDDLLAPLSRQRGLPIGNLTSQFFANLYMNGFDHFCKEKLHTAKYLRYVDDFALFSDDATVLTNARPRIEEYLADRLRLMIHPIKSQQFETRQGANFVGFRILPNQIRIQSKSLKRGRIKVRELQHRYAQQDITLGALQQSLKSWFAHLNHGNTHHLQQQISRVLNPVEALEMG